jgi:hypothetical protein
MIDTRNTKNTKDTRKRDTPLFGLVFFFVSLVSFVSFALKTVGS